MTGGLMQLVATTPDQILPSDSEFTSIIGPKFGADNQMGYVNETISQQLTEIDNKGNFEYNFLRVGDGISLIKLVVTVPTSVLTNPYLIFDSIEYWNNSYWSNALFEFSGLSIMLFEKIYNKKLVFVSKQGNNSIITYLFDIQKVFGGILDMIALGYHDSFKLKIKINENYINKITDKKLKVEFLYYDTNLRKQRCQFISLHPNNSTINIKLKEILTSSIDKFDVDKNIFSYKILGNMPTLGLGIFIDGINVNDIYVTLSLNGHDTLDSSYDDLIISGQNTFSKFAGVFEKTFGYIPFCTNLNDEDSVPLNLDRIDAVTIKFQKNDPTTVIRKIYFMFITDNVLELKYAYFKKPKNYKVDIKEFDGNDIESEEKLKDAPTNEVVYI
jgi:hypothetical protein